jgi:hypothetical protein
VGPHCGETAYQAKILIISIKLQLIAENNEKSAFVGGFCYIRLWLNRNLLWAPVVLF